MKRRDFLALAGASLAGLMLDCTLPSSLRYRIPGRVKKGMQNGVSLTSWVSDFKEALPLIPHIAEFANYAALISHYYMEDKKSTELFTDPYRSHDLKDTAKVVKTLHDHGMGAMLKTHIDLKTKGWRGWIYHHDKGDRRRWQRNYEKLTLKLAKFCQYNDVEIFCIGTELKTAVNYTRYWRDLIDKVRNEYDGKLIYAANWGCEHNVRFWDKLDFIGSDMYAPVRTKSMDVREYVRQLHPRKMSLKILHDLHKKPVVISEFGIPSIKGAQYKPWTNKRASHMKSDLRVQKVYYEAMLRSFYYEPWVTGMYNWIYFPWKFPPDENPLDRSRSYTVENKPAEEVLKRYYKGKH